MLTFLISLCKSFSLLVSDFMVLNDRLLVSDELECIWKEVVMAYVKNIPSTCPRKVS
jgi:hypothetical protein